jgi:hypothetical protein
MARDLCIMGCCGGSEKGSSSAVQCSAVQCSAVQSSAVQCSAEQFSAVQCSAVQFSAVQCSAVQSKIRLSVPSDEWRKKIAGSLRGQAYTTYISYLKNGLSVRPCFRASRKKKFSMIERSGQFLDAQHL